MSVFTMNSVCYPDLKHKIVIITGASSGIGKATAKYFALQCCRLTLVGRNVEALKDVEQQCVSLGAEADDLIVVKCDLSDASNCFDVVKQTIAKFGALDVVINNAGMLSRDNFEDVTVEEIDKCMQVNLNSAIKLSQLSLPYLKKSLGCIVNVSSIAGLRAYPGALAYKMSKAALDQMTRCVALEVASHGIRVNSVNPGVIVTEIFRRSGMTDHQTEMYMEQSKALHPLGRPGQPEEVAAAIVFLASQQASFITGQTLAIDGGRSVALPFVSYTK